MSLGGKISGGRGRPPTNVFIPLKRQLTALQLCRLQLFLYDETLQQTFYSARNARIASAVLATAMPSVCLSVRLSLSPSVTRRYCVKTAARSTVQFAPLDSKMCLVL